MKTTMREAPLRHLTLMTVMFVLGGPLGWANEHDEEPFPVGRLFFQLNDTDEDLGIHLLVDGEPWKSLEIDAPDDRRIFYVNAQGKLRRQGITEFKFESAEPDFDTFPARRFFRRFPEGEYDIEAMRRDGQEYESTVAITHLLPAPPEGLAVNGIAAPEDCEQAEIDGTVPVVTGPFVISWDPVTKSHPDLGTPNDVDIQVVRYEVAVEREEPTFFTMDADVHAPPLPDLPMTQYEVPGSLLSPDDFVKFQILVQGGDETGMENETSSESCFRVGMPVGMP